MRVWSVKLIYMMKFLIATVLGALSIFGVATISNIQQKTTPATPDGQANISGTIKAKQKDTNMITAPDGTDRKMVSIGKTQNNLTNSPKKGYLIQLKEKPLLQKISSDPSYLEIKRLRQSIVTSYPSRKNEIEKQISLKETKVKKLSLEYVKKLSAQHIVFKGKNKNLKFLPAKEFSLTFNGFAVELDDQEYSKLLIQPEVKRIYTTKVYKPTLNDSVPLINADDVHQLGFTGSGMRIGILDTGVDYRHGDLGGCFGTGCKVTDGYDFANNDADPMDDIGHGTHVAATAAGKGTLTGVAPDAKIYAYKISDPSGSTSDPVIIAALERVADPNNDGDTSDHLDVVNLSFGADCLGYADSFNCGADDPVSLAFDNLVNIGTVAVISAGNLGSLGQQSIDSPGTARQALTVGASSKTDTLASFSSLGPVWAGKDLVLKPDILAPGVSICAARWDSINTSCIDSTHVAFSGTSMAAPHIAGAVALLKQKYPTLSPEEIKWLFMEYSRDLGFNTFKEGTGRIDMLRTINAEVVVIPGSTVASLGQLQQTFNFPINFSIHKLTPAVHTYQVSAVSSSAGVTATVLPGVISENATAITLTLSSGGSLPSAIHTGYINFAVDGNQNDILRVPFALVVDTTAPTITSPVVSQIFIPTGVLQLIQWRTDDHTDAKLHYRLRGTTGFSTRSSKGTSHQIKISDLPVGEYEYYVSAINSSEQETINDNNGSFYSFTNGSTPPSQFTRVGALPPGKTILTKVPGIDLDHDGRKEIILSKNLVWSPEYTVYENTGNDTYTPVSTVNLGVPGNDYVSIYPSDVGDSDGDGKSEVLLSLFGYSVRVYEASTATSYPDKMILEIPLASWASGAQFSDFDKDGRQEVVAYTQGGSELIAYENAGDNTYSQIYRSVLPLIHTGQSMITANDLDGDGFAEIIIGGLTPNSSVIYVLENDGSDNSLRQVWSAIPADEGIHLNVSRILGLGDTDSDGYKEFLAGGFRPITPTNLNPYFTFILYEAVGDNNFEDKGHIKIPANSIFSNFALNTLDFNSDGQKDLVIQVDGQVYVLQNSGNNSYLEVWRGVVGSGSNLITIGVGDHDGDSIVELIIHASSETSIYENAPIVVDTTPPTLTITSPADGAVVTSETITVEGTAADQSGVREVLVNAIPASGTSVWSRSLTLTPGDNSITVSAADNSPQRNVTTRTIIVTYQPPIPPSITVSEPKNSYYIGQNIAIVWSSSGVTSVHIDACYKDDSNTTACTRLASNVPITTLTNQRYLWYLDYRAPYAGRSQVWVRVTNTNNPLVFSDGPIIRILKYAFDQDQRVQVVSVATVRSTFGENGATLGTQPAGAVGAIVNIVPEFALYTGGYYWWNANFDSGADGWVREVDIARTITAFDYSLSASANIVVTQGGLGQNTITRTIVSGSSQPITLSASGLPQGASATFTNNPCNPTCSSTLTIAVSSTTPTGTYAIQVTGSPPTRSTSFTLTVNTIPLPFNYSLSSSGDIAVVAGNSGQNSITRTLISGTPESVSLSASGLPSGASATFNLNPCLPSCSSVLTITVSTTTSAGVYTITVTGSPLAKTTSFTLTVSAPLPSLAVSCSVFPTSANTGQNVTWSASPSGGSGSYTYSWSGTDGLSGSTQSVTRTYSTAGTKTASVTVTSGAEQITQSCSNSLIVTNPPPQSINVLSPNGGELWPARSTQQIRWQATNLDSAATVNIEVTNISGQSFNPPSIIANNVLANVGTYSWNVWSFTGQFRIVVRCVSGCISPVSDIGDAPFTVSP